MEALNKESEFAAPVLTWAQKRSDLREKSTVGKFVRSSLQGLNHEDVLLKLETKIINNGKGHARASAHGLRAIMETMLHGSQLSCVDSKIDFCKGEQSLSALCFVKNYLCSMMMRLSPVLKDLI